MKDHSFAADPIQPCPKAAAGRRPEFLNAGEAG